MLKLTVAEVASEADVSPNTVTRVEADKGVNTSTLKAIRQGYEVGGVEFTDGDAPGVRMKAAGE